MTCAPLRIAERLQQCADRGLRPAPRRRGARFPRRIENASRRMAELIDGLLVLSRCSSGGTLRCEPVDLSALAAAVLARLAQAEPQRQVEVRIEPGLEVCGDPRLLGRCSKTCSTTPGSTRPGSPRRRSASTPSPARRPASAGSAWLMTAPASTWPMPRACSSSSSAAPAGGVSGARHRACDRAAHRAPPRRAHRTPQRPRHRRGVPLHAAGTGGAAGRGGLSAARCSAWQAASPAARSRAAGRRRSACCSRQAMVIGPTPPGTGVIAPASAATASKSTSPTSFVLPSSRAMRLMPTSMTVAPGFTQSGRSCAGGRPRRRRCRPAGRVPPARACANARR